MTAFDDLLEAAYDAGQQRGRMVVERLEGYAVDDVPTFEEWRESISGIEVDDAIRRGDLIEIVSDLPADYEIHGLRFFVTGVGAQHYYFVHDGESWYVPHCGAKKVQP